MTKQEALREAADKIESGESGYCWTDTEACNCGVLAQVVLGINKVELLATLQEEFKTHNLWRGLTFGAWTCLISNMRMSRAYLAMNSIGMTDRDIAELENLSNKDIRKSIGIPFDESFELHEESFELHEIRSTPSNVIRYMRAWADMLDEQSEITASAPIEDVAFRPTNTEMEKHNVSI